MERSVSISTTLAEVTPYWEPALWVLIVVVTAGIVGSALWAPSRSGRRRDRRKLFRRSDARARSEERRAAAAVMVPAATLDARADGSAPVDFYAEPEPATVSADDAVAESPTAGSHPASETSEREVAAGETAPSLFDEVIEAPAPAAPSRVVPAVASVEPPTIEAEHAPPPAAVTMVANGASAPERPLEPVTEPGPGIATVAFADVEAGFARLASDVTALAGQVAFFDERSNVPPEMASWPIEHQESLAVRAADALADPVDQLLEHSLTVASDVRALDRLLGRRSHDEDAAQAIVANRIDIAGLRRHLGHVQHRFRALAGDFRGPVGNVRAARQGGVDRRRDRRRHGLVGAGHGRDGSNRLGSPLTGDGQPGRANARPRNSTSRVSRGSMRSSTLNPAADR